MKQYKIFISYTHKDEKFKEQLIVHLASLKRLGLIKEWHDRMINPGQEWDGIVKQELIDADIIILLISSDFIASNYCYDVEIKKAMERHEQGDAIVIPVVVRPCDWKDLPFGKIQGLPKDAKPLSKWDNIDDGYLNIINGIKSLINNESSVISKVESNTDLKEVISFSHDVIIGRLPRGYIVIQDIEFNKNSSWSIVANYFDYNEGWKHGTHYHKSYKRTWETLDGQYTQSAKLGIPKADRNISSTALYLIMELRERNESDKIEDILKTYQNEYFNYYKEGEKITKPVVPKKFIHLKKTGEIRDIIEELRIDSWKNYYLRTLHEDFESNRRKAYLILYKKLDSNHPALGFVKEIVDKYKDDFNIEQLRTWGNTLSDALIDACQYIK
ncbi:MAG: toll/interleukin-1 receptor domain-containing protein [Bacteroidales bacterium]|nr:toll/interleukin-1 receptor domain-containing protein [Bacteroidales bacterium]